MPSLHHPIGIFDAGIGSYAIVERVHRSFPQQDILYLADRASFPYGAKTAEALLASVHKATDWLASQGCPAVILASNAPSIMVLDSLQTTAPVPVIGIFPPVENALQQSISGQVAVLGVKSMVSSDAMLRYVGARCPADKIVRLVNASPMVDLVETFAFLKDPVRTQQEVDAFTAEVLQRYPHTDVMTLSSTHLPWLRPFFEKAAPQVKFLDPADSVIDQIRHFTHTGTGTILPMATESAALPISEFNLALAELGFPLPAQRVSF